MVFTLKREYRKERRNFAKLTKRVSVLVVPIRSSNSALNKFILITNSNDSYKIKNIKSASQFYDTMVSHL